MADKIKVNTSRLGNDADSVKANVLKLKSSMEKMKADVARLNSMWEGESSNAFKKAFTDDMEALNIIIKRLDEIYVYEKDAKTKYDACEKKVASLVSSMKA